MAQGAGGEQGTMVSAEVAVKAGGAGAAPPTRVRWARWTYLGLAWGFVGCVAAQVFIAGMAIFVGAAYWRWHTAFVHAFQYLPLLMLAVVFAARLPVATRWLTGALFALIVVQYATADIGGVAGAFHPVSAFVIFWLAVYLAQRAWGAVRAGGHGTPVVQEGSRPGAAAPPAGKDSAARKGGVAVLGLVVGLLAGFALTEIIARIALGVGGQIPLALALLLGFLSPATAIVGVVVALGIEGRARRGGRYT